LILTYEIFSSNDIDLTAH